jgi:hypothetical protein
MGFLISDVSNLNVQDQRYQRWLTMRRAKDEMRRLLAKFPDGIDGFKKQVESGLTA